MIRQQIWGEVTRYLIDYEHGSVIVDLHNEPQQWGSCYGTAWIWGLYVYPLYRLKGYSKQLLAEAEGIAAKEGHNDVYMRWEEENTPREVLDAYRRQGYHDVEFDVGYVILKKNLK